MYTLNQKDKIKQMIQLLLNVGGGKDNWIRYLSHYLEKNQIEHKVFVANKNLSMIDPRNGPAVVLGLMRGSEVILDLYIKENKTFYNLDHPYLWPKTRKPFILHWKRICKNCLSVNKLYDPKKIDQTDIDRITAHGRNNYLESIQPWNKKGKYILLCPSSYRVMSRIEKKLATPENWVINTTETLKKYTDRPIIVKEKHARNPLHSYFKDCFACVTYTSMAAVECLKAGIPSFCHPASCAAPVSKTDLSQIESPIYPDNREQLIDTFLLNQFNAEETKNGTAWEFINR
tara:strand:- start:1477 stop:2340 length:864 start_codon:yes stop_codon:yes gene_type:complete